MTGSPPANPQPGQDAQQQQPDDQQIDRQHDDVRQRPQRELHELRVYWQLGDALL